MEPRPAAGVHRQGVAGLVKKRVHGGVGAHVDVRGDDSRFRSSPVAARNRLTIRHPKKIEAVAPEEVSQARSIDGRTRENLRRAAAHCDSLPALEGKRVGVAFVGGMPFPPCSRPALKIERWKPGVSLDDGVDSGQLQAVGIFESFLKDARPACDEDGVGPFGLGMSQGRLEAPENGHSVGGVIRIGAQDEIVTAGERGREGLEGEPSP